VYNNYKKTMIAKSYILKMRGVTMLSKIEKILRENTLCVLCTVGGEHPHYSLMTYTLSDNMSVLYMVSILESKKIKNLLTNPNVSLLVDTRQDLSNPTDKKIKSVTFEGTYLPLGEEEIIAIKSHLTKNHLELDQILKSPSCTVFGVKLNSFLFLDGPIDSFEGNL